MKRILASICMGLVLAAGTGCSMQAVPGSVSNKMSGGFTSEVTMTTGENEVSGTLTRHGSDAWSVVFSAPPALDGVQLDYLDGDVEASYKGLAFSVPQSAQAVRTMLEELMGIVDDMAQESELDGHHEDDRFICEGEIDEGEYTLTFAEDGTPQSFSLPCYGLTITFNTFTQSGAAPMETTGTTETGETGTSTETTAAASTAAPETAAE